MSSSTDVPFLPVERDGQINGFELRSPGLLFFFGTRHAPIEHLAENYPHIKLCGMKQEHGHQLAKVPGPEPLPSADALWSAESGTGLVVSSADCVPILIACQNWVAAIHAGWRGILNGIIPRTLQALHNQCGKPESVSAIIGPHIQQQHFDFDAVDAQPFYRLAEGLNLDTQSVIYTGNSNDQKVKISLKAFVRAQLKASGFIAPSNIEEFFVDTYSHADFHSYRRERVAGRNLSFVARL